MKNMVVHVCAWVDACEGSGGAWGVPRGCLVCAWHGIEAQLGQKCVEHTFIDQNMSHMFNQE